MGSKEEHFVDKTILNTPKPKATSTVEKKHPSRRIFTDDRTSLSIQDLSCIPENESSLSFQLREQRSLAENSIQRASSVAGIPSRYFKPNHTNTQFMNMSEDSNNSSTVNESDLLKTPAPGNSSTPKSSVGKTSLSQSVARLSYKILNADFSIDNFSDEFQKAMQMVDNCPVPVDSKIFKPAEEAASMLLADELSWRKQNEIPVNGEAFSDLNFSGKTSIGEFFRQRSDTLSVFCARSPSKSHVPVALIPETDVTESQTNMDNDKVKPSFENNKSLSISAIQKCLQSEDTPRRAAELLLKKSSGSDISRYLLDKKMDCPTVSKTSSYSSEHSENELIKVLCDKENIDNSNSCNKTSRHSLPRSAGSPISRSSSRALTSLPEGKLPIESTVSELVWGCVKTDKCVTQEFSIRNKSAKKLCVQMSLTGYDFKIRKDSRSNADLFSSTKVVLHPYESKLIIVSFIPTRIGACIDMLSFTPVDSRIQQTKRQHVKLFGYGGYDKIEFKNLTRDITGKFWMSLGKIDNQGELQQTFSIVNTGVLPSFVYIGCNSKIYAQVTIDPTILVLMPNEQKKVTVRNVFTAQNFKMMQKRLTSTTLFDLGTLNVVTGTEINRGRLRRLCRKLAEAGSSLDFLCNILKEKFNGEVMPPELCRFKESPSSLKNILDFFSMHEVVLTAERDIDQTILLQCEDDSAMYNTLCEDSAFSVLENTMMTTSCRLEPSTIILTLPVKDNDFLFLICEKNRQHQFQVHCDPEGLEVHPMSGVINAGQEIKISVKHSKTVPPLQRYKISVAVGNEIYESLVKIKS